MESAEETIVIQTLLDNINEDDDTLYSTTSSSESSSSESSDSSSDQDTNKRARITDFMETVDQYSDVDFKRHFRLTRELLASLTDLYNRSEICPSHRHGGRQKVGARKEIHIFIWYVSNTITYRQLGNLFGVNDVTTWKVVNRVASWMVGISNRYIIWPRSTQRVAQTTAPFETYAGMVGILGAIDGSHIKIKRPTKNPVIYYNRKGYYSILLQAVVDSSKRFIDVYCGEPGSMHDARVLRRSPLFRQASESNLFLNNSFLLGDSAYPSNPWLVPPYKDTGNLTDRQKKFNMMHSSTRMVVENAFGLMKGRFRRLLNFTEHSDLGTVINITVACCVLHNICVNHNDSWYETNTEESIDNLDIEFVPDGVDDRRQDVINKLIEKNIL